ncbi:hypothetical protein [Duganella qianjiadongensis]|uniref:Uncharacterized protein n=1 Tax=Duganella qianjiadongensis TaxID=2692176 RepID=A0ABW9VJR0_9BURK|nr:hypothetical protein [Duganella qianjiadongensis]MYM39663.1 hypothetical protein [Duganella qianjiadongensis]
MKKDDLIMLAMLGAGVFLIPKLFAKKAGTSASTSSSSQPWVSEIMRDNGYVYYSDGTVITPDGQYYKQGDLVYSPGGMYAS